MDSNLKLIQSRSWVIWIWPAIFAMLCCCGLRSEAQELNNLRSKKIVFQSDSAALIIDTLSIVPGSMLLIRDGQVLTDSIYFMDPADASLRWSSAAKAFFNAGDTIEVFYRVFPLSFTATRFRRDRKLMDPGIGRADENRVLFTERTDRSNASLFGLEGLNRSGSISRGITIGNNQDAVVNSSLNLQLSGKIGGGIEILAAITDENIPVQPEGNTQQLQEFDRVYIQLNNDRHKLIAGDYDVRNPDGYFMRYFKKAQGGLYNYEETFRRKSKSDYTLSGGIGAAVSRGKFSRMVFNGIESNQGPYRLRGAENELFIVIMSNSERVFIDGQLLERGQDRDYIIDYNTAEITFTTRRLINKDLRITVEFQYADRNYARTLLTGYSAFRDERLQAGLNIYSEQDSKNQPLQQTLTEEDKGILAAAGDNTSSAYSESGDSVAYNVNEILYARQDTVVNAVLYPSVYRYSTNPDSAFYRVSFSNVGQGKGNYVAVDGVANGRIYRWVAPVSGVPQGVYEAKILLIAPRQRQMASGFVRYTLSKQTRIGVELAASKDDANRFSSKDKANDDGYAARINIEHNMPLRKSKPEGWNLIANLQSEINDRQFRPVEVYRSVEFARDWNTNTLDAYDKEWLSNLQVGLRHNSGNELRYGLRSLLRGEKYKGIMQTFNGRMQDKSWMGTWDASWLSNSSESEKSSYLRHREEIRKSFGSWIPGIKIEQERNERRTAGNDSLSTAAFHFRIGELFLVRPDTVQWTVKASVSRREDDGILNNSFKKATVADMTSAGFGWNRNPRQKISILASYRNLQVIDTGITTVRPEESATGRMDFSYATPKGWINLDGYYEGGTGREPKRLYSYVAVAPGTGNFTWNDYNGDGVPQLNEFEVAVFSDQANYIRIFSNSDEYVKVFFNQLNAVVQLNPSTLSSKPKKPVLMRFSLLSSFRFDNRFTGTGGWQSWNPLPGFIPDSVLLSAQSNARHTLFYDRNSSVFAADVSVQEQKSRQLLASGPETRENASYSTTLRWNIMRWLNMQQKVENGLKSSESEAFSNRNYNIREYTSESKFNIQPSGTYRTTFSYRYRQKENTADEGLAEKATIQDAGIELRYNSVKKGLLSIRLNYLRMDYNADTNTPIAFEMLEGLKKGNNITWGLNFQRNLGNSLQLSINYEGRKPADTRVIHTGSAQVRAFF